MDYVRKFTSKLFLILIFIIFISLIGSIATWRITQQLFSADSTIQLVAFGCLLLIWTLFVSYIGLVIVAKPLKKLSDAIVFAGHKSGGTPPPLNKRFLGRELVLSLSTQVYDLASMAQNTERVAEQPASEITVGAYINSAVTTKPSVQQTETMQAVTPNVLDRVASPVFGLDSDQIVRAANKNALEYIGKTADEVIGRPFYDAISMSFDSDETFEKWLKKSQDSVINGVRRWERVRLNDGNGSALKQFDFTASFSKQSDKGAIETMVVLFDRTAQYAHDDQEISFVALAVHELRTPLTIMRGYIEVFQDEVAPTLSPEMVGFMQKMQASAQQLTAFVGNILNVARVEENQLVLTLQQHDWSEIIKAAVADLELRAQVHKKHIELNIADNIPAVAVDRISIHEVINNLVDNAIKYSGDTEKIIITSTVNQDGMIETSVQDFGMGIPDAVVPDLFQKFYRSHRSKVQVGGTGLGLYLCKALVTAHGGNIWVHTKEGQGSIFSFTIQSFEQANTDNKGQDGIQRGAHGWIKNHSMNRQ